MKGIKFLLLVTVFACSMLSCAHRYYLGMHGPSIKAFPHIHSGFTNDAECLGCHALGDESQGPLTSHPQFTGCLKCHND